MNNKSCLNCSSYFFCRKEEKVVGNGCLDFKQTGNIDFLNLKEKSEVIKKPRLISPHKEEEQELVKEDYSEYFLGGGIDKLQLPEEDFPLAKNIYEFVFSKKFLGYILYPKQLEIAIGYFQEYCPDCSDINYVKNIPTNADIDEIFFYVTLLEHEICPKCLKTKYDFIKEGKLTDYINLIGLAGQRVGKSAMTGIFSIYTLHRFLKMDDIFKTFNLLSSSPLQGTFVALNKAQVKYSAWPHIQSLTRNSPWFSGYNEMLQYYGRKVGYKLFDVSKEESVDYFYKNIRYSVATPDKGALRGRSSLCAAVDEIGWFNSEDSSKVKTSADEIYASISRSFLTVSGAFRKLRAQGVLNIPNPTFYVVSSPSHARDKICQLYENSKLNNQEYGFKYATWDIHPDFPRDCQDIQNDYNKDPLKADRDWGANPPLSSNPFIENPSLVEASFNSTRTNLLNIKYSIEANVATGYSYEITKSSIDTTKARVLTLDLSYNDNSTALSIGYFDKVEGRIIVESMNEIIPTMQTKINLIDFLEKIIKPLIPQLNIQIICGDRWNTLPIFQELEKKFKIKAFAYTPSYGDFQFFKQNLINNKIDFPSIEDKEKVYTQDLTNYPLVFYNKPVSHFFFQCITVVDDKKHEDDKKNSVKKGEKTTDDIFRTVVLLHYVLNNYQYKEWLDRKQINKIELSSFGSYDSSSGQKPGSSSPRLSNKYGSVI